MGGGGMRFMDKGNVDDLLNLREFKPLWPAPRVRSSVLTEHRNWERTLKIQVLELWLKKQKSATSCCYTKTE